MKSFIVIVIISYSPIYHLQEYLKKL